MHWDLLIYIKNQLSKIDFEPQYLTVKLNTGEFELGIDEEISGYDLAIAFMQDLKLPSDRIIQSVSPFRIDIEHSFIEFHDLEFFYQYLPYALLPVYSRKNNRCYSITHFAQSLDGRIASSSGKMEWIGNEENLIHAHRMRALCDGILVGSKTIDRDRPQLNVRHVSGNDPIKVIIGEVNGEVLNKMSGKLIHFSEFSESNNGDIKHLCLEKRDQLYDPSLILESLLKEDICSVYIEGGSFTTSEFLKTKSVDEVQVHLSSKIIGSGMTGFSFQGISDFKHAIQFNHYSYHKIGGEIMFVGTPKYQ